MESNKRKAEPMEPPTIEREDASVATAESEPTASPGEISLAQNILQAIAPNDLAKRGAKPSD